MSTIDQMLTKQTGKKRTWRLEINRTDTHTQNGLSNFHIIVANQRRVLIEFQTDPTTTPTTELTEVQK